MNPNLLWPATVTLAVFAGIFAALAITHNASAIPVVTGAIVAAASGLAHAFTLNARDEKAKAEALKAKASADDTQPKVE